MAVHSQTAWWARQRRRDGGMEASALRRGITLRPREAPLLGTTSLRKTNMEEPRQATGPGPQSPELKDENSLALLRASSVTLFCLLLAITWEVNFMPPMNSMLYLILCYHHHASFHDQVGQHCARRSPSCLPGKVLAWASHQCCLTPELLE